MAEEKKKREEVKGTSSSLRRCVLSSFADLPTCDRLRLHRILLALADSLRLPCWGRRAAVRRCPFPTPHPALRAQLLRVSRDGDMAPAASAEITLVVHLRSTRAYQPCLLGRYLGGRSSLHFRPAKQ